MVGAVIILAVAGCSSAAEVPNLPAVTAPSTWAMTLDKLDTQLRNVCETPELTERRGWAYCAEANVTFLDTAMGMAYDAEQAMAGKDWEGTVTSIAVNQAACAGSIASESDAAQCVGQSADIVATGKKFLRIMAQLDTVS